MHSSHTYIHTYMTFVYLCMHLNAKLPKEFGSVTTFIIQQIKMNVINISRSQTERGLKNLNCISEEFL